jgi:hypothetical protein
MFSNLNCIPKITLEEFDHFVYINVFVKMLFYKPAGINVHAEEVVVLVTSQGRRNFSVFGYINRLRTPGS